MLLLPVSGSLSIDGQPDGDLERRGVGHAALFALRHVVLQLQADRVAALVAEGDDVLVEGAALVAKHVARVERIGADGGAAIRVRQVGAQVMQTLQVAALALPVADRIIDKLELADAAEIGDRKDGFEDSLQTDVVALVRQQVHLQEALVGILLNLDQVRDRDRGLDFRKIDSFAGGAVRLNMHFYPLLMTRTGSEPHALPVSLAHKMRETNPMRDWPPRHG